MNAASKHQLQRMLLPHTPPDGLSADASAQPSTESWLPRTAARVLSLRRKAATAVLAALSVSLGAYAIFGHDGLVAYQHKQNQSRLLQQEILSLQQENQRLALHDQKLQGDRDTIEYEAREQMHYTRPGEVIYTLPQASAAASPHK